MFAISENVIKIHHQKRIEQEFPKYDKYLCRNEMYLMITGIAPPGYSAIPVLMRFRVPQETYGAQPPIEILRQMIDARAYPDSGGWYDRKETRGGP